MWNVHRGVYSVHNIGMIKCIEQAVIVYGES